MAFSRFLKAIAGITILSSLVAASALAQTTDRFRVSYGGYNETAAPMWVGIEKGIFKKYGIDASMIQVRSGALRSLQIMDCRAGFGRLMESLRCGGPSPARD